MEVLAFFCGRDRPSGKLTLCELGDFLSAEFGIFMNFYTSDEFFFEQRRNSSSSGQAGICM